MDLNADIVLHKVGDGFDDLSLCLPFSRAIRVGLVVIPSTMPLDAALRIFFNVCSIKE
jgi:hypothetical protein